MIGHPYGVEIKSLSEATCDVVFAVEPPVEFINEEARRSFSRNVLWLVCRRADKRDNVLEEGIVELTHNTPDHSATMGYARIESLRYGSGKEIFLQALLTALNGETPDFYATGRAPWESADE